MPVKDYDKYCVCYLNLCLILLKTKAILDSQR